MKIGPLTYTWQDIVRGMVIYSVGDTIASLILGEFSFYRVLGMIFIGGTVYAIEIPNYFRLIDHFVVKDDDLWSSFKRAGLAVLYFNPLWIARHLLFIQIFSGRFHEAGWWLLRAGFWSFLISLPVSIIANYLIQNRFPYRWRFFASATFSSLMAIYYALSEVFFR